MKKVLAVAAPVAVMIFLSNPALAGRNSAPSAPRSGQGAVVLKNTPCFIPVPEPGTFTAQSHAVITPSGNTTLTCHAEVARRGSTFSGRVDEVCSTPGGAVTAGHLVITRSGEVNLSCHVHPRQPAASPATVAAHGEGIEHRWQHGAVAGTGPAQVGRKLGHAKF